MQVVFQSSKPPISFWIYSRGTWYVKWRVCSSRKSSTHPLIWECFFQNTHVYDQFIKICQRRREKWFSTQLYGKKSPTTHLHLENFQLKTHPYAPRIPAPKFKGVPSGVYYVRFKVNGRNLDILSFFLVNSIFSSGDTFFSAMIF